MRLRSALTGSAENGACPVDLEVLMVHCGCQPRMFSGGRIARIAKWRRNKNANGITPVTASLCGGSHFLLYERCPRKP